MEQQPYRATAQPAPSGELQAPEPPVMDGSSSSKRKAEAQREGESSAKRLNVTVGLETLDCTMCCEPLRPTIFSCSVGHFICSSCRDKILDKKCPTCSIKTSFKRCFGMEHVIQSVTFPCSNAKYGCREGHEYYQKEGHEQVCPYAPCFCPASDCSFTGLTHELLDHLTIYHMCPSPNLPYHGTVSLRLEPGINVLAPRNKSNNHFFMLNMEPERLGYAISVVCVQPNATEPKFACSMSYDCSGTGYCGSASCQIKSSTLSDGLPTDYDLIPPKGKISGDRKFMMLRITIHHASSGSGSGGGRHVGRGLTTRLGCGRAAMVAWAAWMRVVGGVRLRREG
ncbi:E3 ubiquitin-protein ligase SINA-like 7 [Triticum aestivum]|uniref:E3 ubiquitin-protein ligase SINA-like 7 n=1 Tax=Triticum aestivum TaxID=4565 RepID=UPI001D01E17F|nr:E3 ubiquitin-protein ligase SINA-like 7 [Triticum aestivum]